MGEVAGVTSCRPAMLQTGGGEGAKAPPVVHFISFRHPLLFNSSLAVDMKRFC